MLLANYLSKTSFTRATLVCAFGISLGSAAMAAESQASSMAGGMNDSGATTSSTSSAQQSGSNQSSGSSSSLSTTDRSSSSSSYDSSMTGSGPAVAVKNVASDSATLRNPSLPAAGQQALPKSNSNGLIQNNVRQNESDFAPSKAPGNGQGTSAGSEGVNATTRTTTTTTTAAASAVRVPRAKVQYWNQRRTTTRRVHH